MHAAIRRKPRPAAPHPIPVRERLRRLPGAMLLTAGYFASRTPALSYLLRRLD